MCNDKRVSKQKHVGKQNGVKSEKGQTIFELVVVIGILALIITGVIAMVSVSIRNSGFSKQQSEAARFNQEATEYLRQQRDIAWSNIFSKATGNGATYCMQSLNLSSPGECPPTQTIPNTGFVRKAKLTSQDANTVLVEVEVSWKDSRSTLIAHKSLASTVLTNWRKR